MHDNALVQGRVVSVEDLGEIRSLLSEHPAWHRTLISRELCQRWGWRNEAGRLKDMACRTLLLKWEARGLIELPTRQRASANGSRDRTPAEVPCNLAPLTADWETLQPLKVQWVGSGSPEAGLFQWLLHRYHYLSLRNCVGENLKYLALSSKTWWVACVEFSPGCPTAAKARTFLMTWRILA